MAETPAVQPLIFVPFMVESRRERWALCLLKEPLINFQLEAND